MNWKPIIRDALIIVILTAIGGFIIGISGAPDSSAFLAIIVSNILFTCVGFTISGAIAKINRFQHLFKVAICVWIFGLINIFFGLTFLSWVFSSIFVLICMGIGGLASFIFVRTPKT